MLQSQTLLCLLTFGPQFDSSQREPEVVYIGHETQDLVRHSAAVQRAHALLVQILEKHIVAKVERVWENGKRVKFYSYIWRIIYLFYSN